MFQSVFVCEWGRWLCVPTSVSLCDSVCTCVGCGAGRRLPTDSEHSALVHAWFSCSLIIVQISQPLKFE